jgi:hypothetical protein
VIQEICGQVHAPMPKRVSVDCDVNASAGLMRGVFRRDLELTIGLPLAAGFTIRQLSGVLAHEFGHFAQGGGMRLTVIVRSINGWFARVVYERDQWDEWLARVSQQGDWRLVAVLALARGAVWLSRKILTGLMIAGHAISCFMLRQMEYDADCYEVKLAGSDTFAETFLRLKELGAASQFAHYELADGLRRGRVPVDLASYVSLRVGSLPVELHAAIRKSEGKTGVFDTHPCDADRLRAADGLGLAGIIDGGHAPATSLFGQFEDLSARVTRDYYQHELGLETGQLTLVATDQAVTQMTQRQERQQTLAAFFGDCLSAYRPLRLDIPQGLTVADLTLASETAAAEMRTLAGAELAGKYNTFGTLEGRKNAAFSAETLLQAGFTSVDAASFGLENVSPYETARVQREAREQQRLLDTALAPYENAARQRLSAGVALWLQRQRDAAGPSTQTSDVLATVDALNGVTGAMPLVFELQCLRTAAIDLSRNIPVSPDTARAQRCLGQLENRRDAIRQRLSAALGAVVPSSISPETITIAAYVGVTRGDQGKESADMYHGCLSLYFELLGRMARVASDAEKASGIGAGDAPLLGSSTTAAAT